MHVKSHKSETAALFLLCWRVTFMLFYLADEAFLIYLMCQVALNCPWRLLFSLLRYAVVVMLVKLKDSWVFPSGAGVLAL